MPTSFAPGWEEISEFAQHLSAIDIAEWSIEYSTEERFAQGPTIFHRLNRQLDRLPLTLIAYRTHLLAAVAWPVLEELMTDQDHRLGVAGDRLPPIIHFHVGDDLAVPARAVFKAIIRPATPIWQRMRPYLKPADV